MNKTLKACLSLLTLLIVGLAASQSQAAMIYETFYQSRSQTELASSATNDYGPGWINPYTTGRGTLEIRRRPDDFGRWGLSMHMTGGSSGMAFSAIELQVDLSQHSNLVMQLDHYVFEDRPVPFDPMLTSYQGYSSFSGISISDNGLDWVPIWSPTNVSSNPSAGEWTNNATIDLSQAIADSHLNPVSNFQIRFQQYSNAAEMDSDGRAYDNIRISGNTMPSAVPEPSTMALLSLGAVCGIVSSGRRRRRPSR